MDTASRIVGVMCTTLIVSAIVVDTTNATAATKTMNDSSSLLPPSDAK